MSEQTWAEGVELRQVEERIKKVRECGKTSGDWREICKIYREDYIHGGDDEVMNAISADEHFLAGKWLKLIEQQNQNSKLSFSELEKCDKEIRELHCENNEEKGRYLVPLLYPFYHHWVANQNKEKKLKELFGSWRAASNCMLEAEGDGPYRDALRDCAKQLEKIIKEFEHVDK